MLSTLRLKAPNQAGFLKPTQDQEAVGAASVSTGPHQPHKAIQTSSIPYSCPFHSIIQVDFGNMTDDRIAMSSALYQNQLAVSLCVGVNLLFLFAGPVAFFASTVQNPKTPSQDDTPFYGFLSFCSFRVINPYFIFGGLHRLMMCLLSNLWYRNNRRGLDCLLQTREKAPLNRARSIADTTNSGLLSPLASSSHLSLLQ